MSGCGVRSARRGDGSFFVEEGQWEADEWGSHKYFVNVWQVYVEARLRGDVQGVSPE